METIKTSNTNNTNKKGLNFLALKEDTKYSSSEDEAVAISMLNREEELEEPDDNDYEHKELDNDEEEEPDEDGHYEDKDTDDNYKTFAFLQKDAMCFLQDKPGIMVSWILLDSQ